MAHAKLLIAAMDELSAIYGDRAVDSDDFGTIVTKLGEIQKIYAALPSVADATCLQCGTPMELVRPGKWQRTCGCGEKDGAK